MLSFQPFRILGILGLLLALFVTQGAVQATEDVIVIVEVAPGVDLGQLSNEYQMTLLDSIEVLSLHRFQGGQSGLVALLEEDGRILSVQLEKQLESRPNLMDTSGSDFMDATVYEINESLHFIDSSARFFDASARFFDASARFFDASARFFDASGTPISDPYRMQPSALNIRVNEALDIATGEGVVVAVLDSGVDLDHPFLLENMIDGYDFVDNDNDPSEEADGIDNDGDGLIDESAGHGTHVSGIINLVSPSVKIMPIRIFDTEGHATYFNAATAIVYAVDHGADVINLSGNGPDDTPLLNSAIAYAWQNGVVVVAAAGVNEIRYPGSYDQVISVGTVDDADYRSDFARYENNLPTVYAPGMNIFSGYLDGGLAEWTGNSMATPFVAGEVALMLSTGTCDFMCAFETVASTGHPISDADGRRIDVFDAVASAANQPQTRLKIQYQLGNQDLPSDTNIQPHLNIVNEGTSLNLDALTVRYWYQSESSNFEFSCDYAAVGCAGITAVFNQTSDGHQYSEFQFADTNVLFGGDESGDLQFRLNHADWQSIDETDDYSYAGFGEYTDWENVTIYQNGELVWGVEPNGNSADMSWNEEPPEDDASEPAPEPDPAPAPQTAAVAVQYFTNGNTAVSNQISANLQLVNNGTEAVALEQLTVRYWLDDVTSETAVCDYAVLNCAHITTTFGANYLELAFTGDAGTLSADAESGTIQLRVHRTDWSNFDQSTHYSYNPDFTTHTDWENITIYQNGTLVWGVEP